MIHLFLSGLLQISSVLPTEISTINQKHKNVILKNKKYREKSFRKQNHTTYICFPQQIRDTVPYCTCLCTHTNTHSCSSVMALCQHITDVSEQRHLFPSPASLCLSKQQHETKAAKEQKEDKHINLPPEHTHSVTSHTHIYIVGTKALIR